MGPINGRLALGRQQLIGLGEMAAAQESPVSGQRAGVDRLQQVVALPVHAGRLLLGVGAPQQEHHTLAVLRDPTDDSVRKLLPTLVLKGGL